MTTERDLERQFIVLVTKTNELIRRISELQAALGIAVAHVSAIEQQLGIETKAIDAVCAKIDAMR